MTISGVHDWPVLGVHRGEEEHPGLRVDFVHTNMSSNWGRQFEDMQTKLGAADAVVVMRMIRTQLGRSIRQSCRIWVPCVGHGKESIKRAIVRAAMVAAEQGRC